MTQPLRILILTEIQDRQEPLQEELNKSGLPFSSEWVRGEDFQKALELFKPDLILAAAEPPEALSCMALARAKRPEALFVLLADPSAEEQAIELLRQGAEDVVFQDRPSRLRLCLARAERQARARAETKRLKEQLLQAEKMSSVGLLIGGVAHELNNPLTAILGHLQLLLMETPKEGPLHADLSVVLREVNRCIRLIKGLLAFARKHEHQLRDCDLNELVQEILELKGYDLRRAKITLVQDLSEGLPRICADPHQIQQVLLNLLNNAQQAMEKTQGTLRVQTRFSDCQVRLVVSDTGPGIAPEHLERIFEPFFTTKQPGKGTGLGLSLCSEILKNHGGTLTAESKPGEGASFTACLPVRTLGRPEGRRNRRILLLDDQGEVLQTMARALKHSGREVSAFTSPEQALEALRSSAFDLVISDYSMPGMDGDGFYRSAVALRPELAGRFILVTGDPDKARPFTDLERISLLVKPFDLAKFEQAIQDFEAPLPCGGAR